MKKSIIVLAMIISAAAVFATGAQEVNEDGVVELNPGEVAINSFLEDLETIDLSGTVQFESPIPELRANGKEYTLVAPGAMPFIGYLKEGQKIKVTGYVLDEDSPLFMGGGRMGGRFGGNFNDSFEALKGNTEILVETVEIDGTVYQLPWVDGNFAENRPGPRGGFMDSRPGSRGRNGGYRNLNYCSPYFN